MTPQMTPVVLTISCVMEWNNKCRYPECRYSPPLYTEEPRHQGLLVLQKWTMKRPWGRDNRLNPNIKIEILIQTGLYFFNRSSRENLLKYQIDSSSLIMHSILMSTLFYKALKDITRRNLMLTTLSIGHKGLTQMGESIDVVC